MSSDATQADRLGHLIFEVFRLNGRLLGAGDTLVAPLGLTSARWQVMWAVDVAREAQPVAHLARLMELNRQGVQRIVNELVGEGMLVLTPNPNHLRAPLVGFSARGRDVYAAAGERRGPWLAELARDMPGDDIDHVVRLMATLRRRLEGGG